MFQIDIDQYMHELSTPKLSKGMIGTGHRVTDIHILHRTSVIEIQDEPLVMKWVKGDISNYSYLMALNHLAGK